jgi:hypothetical protein
MVGPVKNSPASNQAVPKKTCGSVLSSCKSLCISVFNTAMELSNAFACGLGAREIPARQKRRQYPKFVLRSYDELIKLELDWNGRSSLPQYKGLIFRRTNVSDIPLIIVQDSTPDESAAARLIQETFRRHLRLKEYNKSTKVKNPNKYSQWPVRSEADIKAFGKQKLSVAINLFPRLPSENPLQKENAEKWIKHHSASSQPTARKVIQIMCYRSHAKFLKRLRQSVESFNRELACLPENERQFAVFVPNVNKSNAWVTALALRYLAKMPVDIVCDDTFDAFCKTHPGIKKMVVFDDAVYSGEQLSSTCSSYDFHKHKFKVYAVAPFMTAGGAFRLNKHWMADYERMLGVEELGKIKSYFSKKELRSLASNPQAFLSNRKMKKLEGSSPTNFLSETELKTLADMTEGENLGNLRQRPLTWFAHKIADTQSTIYAIFEGQFLDSKSGRYVGIRFVNFSKPPYRPSIVEADLKAQEADSKLLSATAAAKDH